MIVNNVMAIDASLDVIDKYEKLLESSISEYSIYMKTKDTLTDIVNNGDMPKDQKAKVLSDVLVSMNSSVVNACLQTALAWANKEKDMEFGKAKLAAETEALIQEAAIKLAELAFNKHKDVQIQAQTIREYGVPVVAADNTVTALSDSGKEYQTILVLQEQVKETIAKTALTEKQAISTDAAIHKVVADTYANFGNFSYSLGPTGVTNVVRLDTQHDKLSDYQKQISAAQVNGYTYNVWANAVNSSSAMIGTAITSDLDIFRYVNTATGDISSTPKTGYEPQTGRTLINTMSTLIGKMSTIPVPNNLDPGYVVSTGGNYSGT